MTRRASVLVSGLMLLLVSVPVAATSIVIDENGHGFLDGTRLSFALQQDPGPGGLAGVLTYVLSFDGVQGDVLLTEGVGGVVNDLLRFNGNGTVIFYSDNLGGADAIADTPTPPQALYANQLVLVELGPEGSNGTTYVPLAGQPGYAPQLNPTYQFISDGPATAVPEPGSMMLVGTGLGLAWRCRRRSV